MDHSCELNVSTASFCFILKRDVFAIYQEDACLGPQSHVRVLSDSLGECRDVHVARGFA
jgi:hypothetical protein